MFSLSNQASSQLNIYCTKRVREEVGVDGLANKARDMDYTVLLLLLTNVCGCKKSDCCIQISVASSRIPKSNCPNFFFSHTCR